MSPKESWLSSEDHEQWAVAMVTCRSGAPWECGSAGECMLGGCFTSGKQAVAAACQMIRRLHSDDMAVQEQLDRAVKFLRDGEERQP